MMDDMYEGVNVESAAQLEQLQKTVPVGHLHLKPSEYVGRGGGRGRRSLCGLPADTLTAES